MPDKGWCWVMLFGSNIIMFLVFGVHYTYGTFYPHLIEEFEQGESETGNNDFYGFLSLVPTRRISAFILVGIIYTHLYALIRLVGMHIKRTYTRIRALKRTYTREKKYQKILIFAFKDERMPLCKYEKSFRKCKSKVRVSGYEVKVR